MLPFVQEILNPRSVLDVGCGSGEWLGAWRELGVGDLLGVDGTHVDSSFLAIPTREFRAVDLAEGEFYLGREFDLVSSLEVGEHLRPECGADFVASLVKHGDVVLFSAAVPGQGGVEHVNEQWPSYWVGQFATHGYHLLDVIRPQVWNDDRIAYYYRQNALLFASFDRCQYLFERCREMVTFEGQSLVHPHLYFTYRRERGVRELIAALKHALLASIHRRIGGS
jgi:SAM-dependent methyltransferase